MSVTRQAVFESALLEAARLFCEAEFRLKENRSAMMGSLCEESGSEDYDEFGRLYAGTGPCRESWPDEDLCPACLGRRRGYQDHRSALATRRESKRRLMQIWNEAVLIEQARHEKSTKAGATAKETKEIAG